MDDNTPATKGDVNLLKSDLGVLREDLKLDVSGLRKDLDIVEDSIHRRLKLLELSMNRGFDKIHDDINQVLTVMANMGKNTQGQLDNHERRITDVEEAIAV